MRVGAGGGIGGRRVRADGGQQGDERRGDEGLHDVGFPFRGSERRIVTASGGMRRLAGRASRASCGAQTKTPSFEEWTGFGERLAEAVRFELTDSFPSPVFKTGALNRSATLPHEAAL
ncbi:hypothetical protein EMIT0158MI4_10450 [Burkholderia ambifaria]